jgi:polysaccharide pyruvyl transferase WcaK-like protein
VSSSSEKISIVGAALSANKGAAAMLETVIACLPSTLGECTFDILTTYPKYDAPKIPPGGNVRVVGLQPLRLALVEFPVACLALVCRKIRLPMGWVRARACRSILDSAVVVDVAGISFVDGRGIPITIYNALMTGLSLLLGVPTVKAAQALGPFKTQPNRLLAKMVLPRLAAVCARGIGTREHLDTLHLSNVADVADLAFSLKEAGSLPEHLSSLLAPLGGNFVVLMPSSVIRSVYESTGGDYVEAVTAVVRGIRETTGLGVVIAPHSYRIGRPEGRMNDGPVCQEIAERCAEDPSVVVIAEDLSAGELRHLIAMGVVLVTSRFHAMISGLSTCTPTVVIGWSHKFKEVLQDFGLVEYGMDSTALSSPNEIVKKVLFSFTNRAEIRNQINLALPEVKVKSQLNFKIIAQVVKQNSTLAI